MNSRRKDLAILGTLAVIVLSGCDNDVVAPAEASPEAAEALALFLADSDATFAWSEGALADRATGQVSRTVDCPAGGTRSLAASSQSGFDPATGVHSRAWSNTESHDECTIIGFRAGRRFTMTIDGEVTGQGRATFRLPDERGGPRTLLTHVSRRTGTTTTTIDGRSRTCVIDIMRTYEPETGRFIVRGTACGRPLDVVSREGEGRER
jgi:hypothetical protein